MEETRKKVDELKLAIARSREASGGSWNAEAEGLLDDLVCEMLCAGFTEQGAVSELEGLEVSRAGRLLLLKTAATKVHRQWPQSTHDASSASPPAKDPLASVSLFVGIVSLPAVYFVWMLGGPLGLLGIILGMVALRRIKRSRGRLTGRGSAIAGIVLGDTALILALVALAVISGYSSSLAR